MKYDRLAQLRETKYVAGQMETVKLDGVFTGYASIFNDIDLGNDIIAPHAFTGSLARRGAKNIRMLFQHNPDEPIGVWEKIEETTLGLKVQGRIATSSVKGREVLELMRAGALDGLSIGFRTIRARQDPVTSARKILEADLWEISVVTFPMQESARVETVKGGYQPLCSAAGQLPTIREFEKWLVRDAGLTRSDARSIITKGYRQTLSQRDAAPVSSALAMRFRTAARLLSNQ